MPDEVANTTVTVDGREFHLVEPTTGDVLRILNVVGTIAMRAEEQANRLIKNPSVRAVLFGLMATIKMDDLKSLATAVFQFPDDRDGKREAAEWFGEHPVKVTPVIEALMINVSLSNNDLGEAIRAFLSGIGGLEAMLVGLMGAPAKKDKPEDEPEDDSE